MALTASASMPCANSLRAISRGLAFYFGVVITSATHNMP